MRPTTRTYPNWEKQNKNIDFGKFTQLDNKILTLIACEGGVKCLSLYTILLMHRNSQTDSCFPSLALLAKELNTSKSNIQFIIDKLEELGFIEIVKGSRTQSNKYYFPLEDFYTQPREGLQQKPPKPAQASKSAAKIKGEGAKPQAKIEQPAAAQVINTDDDDDDGLDW